MEKVVIIGAGPAGVTAAETLCEFSDQYEIVMLSSEPYPPYSPPAMVEYFLTGKPVHFWKGEDFPSSLPIDYRAAKKVLKVLPRDRAVMIDGGEELSYDNLVITAGSRLYSPVEGSDKQGIYNFKSLKAGNELLNRVKAQEAKTALIVGAGFVGVEIALLLKDMGLDVSMLIRSRIMRNMLDPETSQIVSEMLEARGIKILTGEEADAVSFIGETHAEAVLVRSGKELKADLLIAATGLKPNIELLDGSGIKTDWGIVVDEYMCTSEPGIYAAGDIVETVDRVSGKRSVAPNFPNAVAQGRVVGHNLLGRNIAYTGSDSMNSLKHLGLQVMAAGTMAGEELAIRRNGCLRKLWIKDDRLVGFRLTGDISKAGIYLNLIRRGVNIARIKDYLLEPNFGVALLTSMSLDPSLALSGEY